MLPIRKVIEKFEEIKADHARRERCAPARQLRWESDSTRLLSPIRQHKAQHKSRPTNPAASGAPPDDPARPEDARLG